MKSSEVSVEFSFSEPIAVNVFMAQVGLADEVGRDYFLKSNKADALLGDFEMTSRGVVNDLHDLHSV